MLSCPFCQTELVDDFGLLDCPGCDASLFIEMDGSVRSSQEEPAEEQFAAEVEVPSEAPDEFLMPADPTVVEESPLEEPIPEESQMEDEPLVVPPSVADHFESTDMADLATAIDQRGAIDGLRYDLKISGIDTADLRREVFEAFVDKKLGWDAEEVINSINAGVLELKSISAVKAHVLVQRLKVLPLQIRWDQYADS